MVESTTSIYHLTKPDIGGSKETWGNYLNADLDRVDAELALHNKSQWYGLHSGHIDSATVTATKYDSSGNAVDTKPLTDAHFRTAANTLLYTNDIVNSIGISTDFFAGNKPGSIAPMDYLWRALDLLMPTGMIIMWSGLSANIPAGWRLCDGAGSTEGVPVDGLPSEKIIIPDLRGRFIMAANEDASASDIKPWYKSGEAGVFGHTHASTVLAHVLTKSQIPVLEVRAEQTTSLTPVHGSDSLIIRTNVGRTEAEFDQPTKANNPVGDSMSSTAFTMSGTNQGVPNSPALGHAHDMNNVPNTGDPDSPFFTLCYIIKWRNWQSWARTQTGPI